MKKQLTHSRLRHNIRKLIRGTSGRGWGLINLPLYKCDNPLQLSQISSRRMPSLLTPITDRNSGKSTENTSKNCSSARIRTISCKNHFPRSESSTSIKIKAWTIWGRIVMRSNRSYGRESN